MDTHIIPLLLSALFFLSYFFFHLYYILFLFFYFLMLFQKPLQMTRKELIDPPLLLQGTIQKVGLIAIFPLKSTFLIHVCLIINHN